MGNDTPNPRPALLGLLELLASREKQLAYEQSVPFVSINNELLSMWFDDLYLPESAIFKQSFSEEELAALRSFNDCYQEEAEALERIPGGIQTWLESDSWLRVMHKAEETITRLRG